jgi:hypothetical protein
MIKKRSKIDPKMGPKMDPKIDPKIVQKRDPFIAKQGSQNEPQN